LSENRLFCCLKKIEICAKKDIVFILCKGFVAFRENFSEISGKTPDIFRKISGVFEITPGDFPENTGRFPEKPPTNR
jgi:hypothetical protein